MGPKEVFNHIETNVEDIVKNLTKWSEASIGLEKIAKAAKKVLNKKPNGSLSDE